MAEDRVGSMGARLLVRASEPPGVDPALLDNDERREAADLLARGFVVSDGVAYHTTEAGLDALDRSS